ncbi:MAG: TlpA family protein disulfide reductase, partial [Nitrospiraceae bacterium]
MKVTELKLTVLLITVLTVSVHSQAAERMPADLFNAVGVQALPQKSPAPSFSLPGLEGQMMDSSALRGKVVLVNFWATWCGPCKEEMPALERLQQVLPKDAFAVIAITTDQQREALRGFAELLGLSFPLLLDESKDVSAAFGVRALPTTVIIDREGHVVGKALGPRQWDSPRTLALLKLL